MRCSVERESSCVFCGLVGEEVDLSSDCVDFAGHNESPVFLPECPEIQYTIPPFPETSARPSMSLGQETNVT